MNSPLIRLLLAASFFTLFSCTKEMSLEKGDNSVQTKGAFYATIGGSQWNADSLQLVQVSNGGVSISGLSKTGIEISMVLPVFKTGTYALSATSVPFAFYVNLNGSLSNVYYTNAGTASGTVTISSIDTVNHLLSGTFQFTAVNPSDNSSMTISSGVFSYLPYSGGTGSGNQTGSGKDTLKALVGNAAFNPYQITAIVNGDQLTIAGIATDGSGLGLLMPDTIQVGTYNMDFGTANYVGVYEPQGSTGTLVSQANGTLKILSHDIANKRISGTFSFIATPLVGVESPATITQGYFSVGYQ